MHYFFPNNYFFLGGGQEEGRVVKSIFFVNPTLLWIEIYQKRRTKITQIF